MKKITKTKLKKFHQDLLRRQNLILEALKHRTSKEDLDSEGDEIDVVQGKVLSDILETLSFRDKQNLTKIDIALHKISKGEFGICENCDELIPEKRLLAIPESPKCVGCLEIEEKEAKQFRQ
jgi:DnaK suppressor protein